jgi:hypothetical protein
MPAVTKIYIPKERSVVFLVLKAFRAWGMAEIVVRAPATKPKIAMLLIDDYMIARFLSK